HPAREMTGVVDQRDAEHRIEHHVGLLGRPRVAQRLLESGACIRPRLWPRQDVDVLWCRLAEAFLLALFLDLQIGVVEDALDLLDVSTYPFRVELALAHAASGWLAHRGPEGYCEAPQSGRMARLSARLSPAPASRLLF